MESDNKQEMNENKEEIREKELREEKPEVKEETEETKFIEEKAEKDKVEEKEVETKKAEKSETEEKEKKEKIEEKQEKKEVKEQKSKPRIKFLSSEWYDNNYKKLFFLMIVIFLIALGSIFAFYIKHGDIMNKDVSLTGGTTITIYTSNIDIKSLESFLKNKLDSVNVRKLEDITTRKTIAFVIETSSDVNTTKTVLEKYLNYTLDDSNSSVEVSSSSLAKTFYKQLLIAIIIAFVLMAIVVFIIFRTIVLSLAVVFCAAFDVIGALALANLFGFRISTAGIAAFLMLIGYSVDTDTMLTTKVIKRRGEGALNSRIKSAFKTGIIMTLTSLVAVFIGYFIAQSSVIKEIFFILSCGLFSDIIGTWIGNAAIIKWYCEKKKIS